MQMCLFDTRPRVWYPYRNFRVSKMKRSKRIAILALLLALTVILSLIPLRVSSATLALTLLPVFVLALTQDFVTGLLGGLVMGLTSLVMAFSLSAGSLTAPIFQNPLVSVLPRLFVPAAVFAVMKGLSALFRAAIAKKKSSTDDATPSEHPSEQAPAPDTLALNAENDAPEHTPEAHKMPSRPPLPRLAQALADGIACLIGVLTNTGLVLGMMWALYGGKSVGDTLISPEFMSAMLSVNFVIEAVVFPLITPPIAYAVRKVR